MDALLRLSYGWHRRCMADPVASHPFSHLGLHPQHSERLAAYWTKDAVPDGLLLPYWGFDSPEPPRR